MISGLPRRSYLKACNVVARKLNRNYIGFELNPAYIKIAERKLYRELGIFT